MRGRRTLIRRRPTETLTLLRLGDNIRARRWKLGMTQVELAAGSGLDQTHISSIECGRRHANPSFLAILKIARALGVTLAALCRRIDRRA